MVRSLLFASAAAAVSAQCAPGMFWVNYMNGETDMEVSWTTPCSSGSVVQYGTTPALGSTATGNQTQYKFAETGYVSPYLHHVYLTGLTPRTQYYYRVGDGSAAPFSALLNFTSHPGFALAPGGAPTLFAVIGDLGQTSNSADTLAHIQANPSVQAVIHAGDLSYADNDEPRWDSWQTLTAPVSGVTPWMTVVGNHEIELDTNLQTFEAYMARWTMPAINAGTPQQSSQLYYSFRAAGVHWLMLSSYSDYSTTSTQYAWLVQELASVNRTLTPWLIAVLHAPWYNSNNAHQGEGEAMRQSMESLLFKANVDLVLAGHVHAYERSYRSYNLSPNPTGAYYVTIGDGGNREGLATNWISPQPSWSAYRQAAYGHGELAVLNGSALQWTWHQNAQAEPVVTDSFYIIKGQDTTHAPVTAAPYASA